MHVNTQTWGQPRFPMFGAENKMIMKAQIGGHNAFSPRWHLTPRGMFLGDSIRGVSPRSTPGCCRCHASDVKRDLFSTNRGIICRRASLGNGKQKRGWRPASSLMAPPGKPCPSEQTDGEVIGASFRFGGGRRWQGPRWPREPGSQARESRSLPACQGIRGY